MGLDNGWITMIGVVTAAVSALVMAAAIRSTERSASDQARARTRGPAEPGPGAGLQGDRA